MLEIDDHPLLEAAAFVTEFAKPIGSLETPESVLKSLQLESPAIEIPSALPLGGSSRRLGEGFQSC